ncbi:DegV family protein [Peribacillus alkalitolerans]|uniref:DegV family protein n=1 Tax=Peribacillus alkalitolerans TaxID=1550385 RepID=UPI0013D237CC|nr:DegV family protein [Peribacillus alkalitolerans]
MTQKKIAWITDSTVLLTDELKNHPDVYVVPLTVSVQNRVYEDGVDLTTDQLYEIINNEKEIPKTSQPSVGKFNELYEKLKGEYEVGIAVHISSKLSGTLSSSAAGAEMAGFNVETVDSLIMSSGISDLIEMGIRMQEANTDYKIIAQALREETKKNENYILLGNLDQFYKGGRMSGTQFLLGNILQIKPIIRIHEGAFELFEKVRSEKKATKRLMELLDEAYKNYQILEVHVLHANVLEKAKAYADQILSNYPKMKVRIGELTSTISVHCGEGTIALTWRKQPK